MAFSGAVHTVFAQADDETSQFVSQLQGTYTEESAGVFRRGDGKFYLLRVEDVPGLGAAAEPGWCFAGDASGRHRLAWAASQDADQPVEVGWLAEAEDGWQGAAVPAPLTVARAGAPHGPEEDARPVDCLFGAAEAAYGALTHPDTQQCVQLAAQHVYGLAKELSVHAWDVVSLHAQKLCGDRPRGERHLDVLSAASEVLSERLDDETASFTDADADELASEFGWNHVQALEEPLRAA